MGEEGTAPMGWVVADGQTDPARHPEGRFGTGEDLGWPRPGPPHTHRTQARRGGWPWTAAPAAAGPAASCGEGGPAGTRGCWVLCRGRGPPFWQGCCGREEQALPYTGPGPPLPCLPNPDAPAAIRGGSRDARGPPAQPALHPPKGSNTPNPGRSKPTDQFLTASHGKGFTLLGLYWCFSRLKIFSGIQPRCRRSSGSLSGPQGHQKPPTALKPRSWIRFYFFSSSLNNGGAASSAGLQVATGSPEQDGGPRDAPFLPRSLRWGGRRRYGAARSPLDMEPRASPGSVSSTPCPKPQNLGQGRRGTLRSLLLPAEPPRQPGSAAPASCSPLASCLTDNRRQMGNK